MACGPAGAHRGKPVLENARGDSGDSGEQLRGCRAVLGDSHTTELSVTAAVGSCSCHPCLESGLGRAAGKVVCRLSGLWC